MKETNEDKKELKQKIRIFRNELNHKVDKYGLNAKETIELSKIINILINEYYK